MYGLSSKVTVKVAALVVTLLLLAGGLSASSEAATGRRHSRTSIRQRTAKRQKTRRVSAKTRRVARRRPVAKPNVSTTAKTVAAGTATSPADAPGAATSPAAVSGAAAPVAVEPFSAIAREVWQGNSTALLFKRTELDDRARATAQVVLRGRQLFVRVKARNLPPPSRYGQRNYVLWVDLPNYGQKLFLGDLPLVGVRRRTGRGDSDTAYYSASLPEGATFGGLMLTAEPKRYVPSPNEPLHLILVALPAKGSSGAGVADAPKSPADAKGQSQKAEAQKRAQP